jgi:hypothetical protein
MTTLNESFHNEILGGSLIFYGHIFLSNFPTILTDLSPLDISFLNSHGYDDGGISLLWLSPAGTLFSSFIVSPRLFAAK